MVAIHLIMATPGTDTKILVSVRSLSGARAKDGAYRLIDAMKSLGFTLEYEVVVD